MADNKGTKVIAPIVTPSATDSFPTHISSMGQGGWHVRYSLVDRDLIPMDRREEGMICYVIVEKIAFQLVGGIDNAFWEIFMIGAGGATSASSLAYSPSGNLIGTNVQSAIDELEAKKANLADLYSKAETDNLINNLSVDYTKLTNLPDLSQLHEHNNIGTLDKFTETMGELVWDGKTLGNMIADLYDADKDGLVDKAFTLEGLTVPSSTLNFAAGLTGNIQQQINALSSGTVFKGEFDTFADMTTAIPNPSKGDWIFIKADENYANAQTQYYHDGTDWIYGGGSSQTPSATDTTKGSIMLKGALDNPNGTADNPLLSETGVLAGLYKNANVVVDVDGRITHAEEGKVALVNDVVTNELETWSSSKISDLFDTKSNVDHKHDQLHDANMLGNVKLDATTLSDKKVITYNAITGSAEWKEPTGGKVYVGSKVISGDFRLVAGSYTSLFIDETAKTVTINSIAQTPTGGGGVPTLTEITHTETLNPGETKRFSLDAAFNKYDIRTVSVDNSANVPVDIGIYDTSVDGRRIYLSNKEINIYDIVNVPCMDKDQEAKIHLEVSNFGSKETDVNIVINTTNLI